MLNKFNLPFEIFLSKISVKNVFFCRKCAKAPTSIITPDVCKNLSFIDTELSEMTFFREASVLLASEILLGKTAVTLSLKGSENKEFPTFSDPQLFLFRLKSRSN